MLLLLFCAFGTRAQQKKLPVKVSADSLQPAPTVIAPPVIDSAKLADSLRKKRIRSVTRRAAILPGWGQISNRQAWKLPFVYAAIGIPAYLFFDNRNQYKSLREAYILKTDNDPTNDQLIPENFKALSANSLKFYRDQFRRNVDYSVVAFIAAWGLNVVDATVFANLRDFDVSDDLSLKIAPQYNPLLRSAGVHLVIKPKHQTPKISHIITR